MRQKPFVNATLRIDESLHRRLRKAADAKGMTLNAEILWRLERTFEQDSLRTIEAVSADLEICWARFGDRFSARELDDEILMALENRNFDRARSLAIVLRKNQEAAARRRTEKMAGGDR